MKAISAARNGLDITGYVRGIAERFTKALDGGVEAGVEVHKSVGNPKSGLKLLASDEAAGFLQELE